jgi:menaquinol-cytochrome c reductase iron-sulfur subunit
MKAVLGMDELRQKEMSRRRFLSRFIIGLSGLAGAVISVPIFAYLLSPLIKPSANVWQTVGALNDFKVGETVKVDINEPSALAWAGQTSKTAIYVRREAERDFTVFAVNCTHLGCPVNWLQDAQLFLCPCHGGVYYASGAVAGGPPPKPLFRHKVRLNQDNVQVLTRPLQVG